MFDSHRTERALAELEAALDRFRHTLDAAIDDTLSPPSSDLADAITDIELRSRDLMQAMVAAIARDSVGRRRTVRMPDSTVNAGARLR